MLKLKVYQSSKIDFNSKSKDMLSKTTDRDNNIYIKRFKQFIDSDLVISNFLKDILDNTKPIPCDEFISPKNPLNGYWLSVKPPVDENQHIVTMYYLLQAICEGDFKSLSSWELRISPNGTKNVDELNRNFLKRTLEPFISYINIFLDKEILKMEQDKRDGITFYQTIHGDNNGVASVGQGEININMTVLQQDKKDILSLIDKSIKDLKEEQIKQDVKDDIIDNLELAQEQVEKQVEKPRRVQRAIESITSFIDQADKSAIKSANLITNLTLLMTKLGAIIG